MKPLAALSAATFFTLSHATPGAIVFSDNFESPDVSAAQSDGNTSGAIDGSKWVRSNQGFGSNRQGTVDESHGDFTDPVGEQAYAFRYTNSGITTVDGAIGALTEGLTYTVTFDVVLDGHNSGTPFRASLVTFNGANRNDTRGGNNLGAGATSLLANITDDGDGSAADGDAGVLVGTAYQTVSFSYTADGTESTLGQDVALRFFGATNTAIIDNVSVEVVPEPGSLALVALGGFLMIRRRQC